MSRTKANHKNTFQGEAKLLKQLNVNRVTLNSLTVYMRGELTNEVKNRIHWHLKDCNNSRFTHLVYTELSIKGYMNGIDYRMEKILRRDFEIK